MAILFFDTETTGLVNKWKPLDDISQPHIVQFAAIITDDTGEVLHECSFVVDPGIDIPEISSKIHGITTEKARQYGITERQLMDIWDTITSSANIKTVVAHNIDFDKKIIEIAKVNYNRISSARYASMEDLVIPHEKLARDWHLSSDLNAFTSIKKAETICTMKMATPLLNLPPTDRMRAAGFNKPKAPSLGECYRHFFKEELSGAHDAMVDVRACARLYFHMRGKDELRF